MKELADRIERDQEVDEELRHNLSSVRAHLAKIDERSGALDERLGRMRVRDIRNGFAALSEGVLSEEEEVVDACVAFARNGFAGRAGDQASIAALNVLPLITASGLGQLQQLKRQEDELKAGFVGLTKDHEFSHIDALAAMGLLRPPAGLSAGNMTDVLVTVTTVGLALLKATNRLT